MKEYYEKMMAKFDEKDKNLRDAMQALVTKEEGEVKMQLADM